MRRKGGAATGALVGQRLGAVLVIQVQPLHHGLRVAAGAPGHLRGTGTLGHVVQSKETLAGAAVRGRQGQAAQVRPRLVPALVVNS